MKTEKKKRNITITQVKSLYVAMRESYINSSSMMVDNAFNGVKPIADKMGLLCCYDCNWFRIMFAHVRGHMRWDRIDTTQKNFMKVAVNQDRI
jgi:hypothetical protein